MFVLAATYKKEQLYCCKTNAHYCGMIYSTFKMFTLKIFYPEKYWTDKPCKMQGYNYTQKRVFICRKVALQKKVLVVRWRESAQ